jgi:hypothetical protein
VRGHYFDWLDTARPDLVRLHRGRFGHGAYQEDDERMRVEGIVRAAARRCSVTGRDRYRGRSERGGDRAAASSPASPAATEDRPSRTGKGEQQLSLL